ncbi:MAG: hypothetical protein AMXMBFR52_07450 [Burkholderiales bacterium]
MGIRARILNTYGISAPWLAPGVVLRRASRNDLHGSVDGRDPRAGRPLVSCLAFRVAVPWNVQCFDNSRIMEETTIIKALAALAQPMRLRAFRALVMAGQAGLTPGTMADGLQAPAATLSFHLKELTNAGLVTQERSGRHLIYRADYGCMSEVLAYLTENCCQGEPCVAHARADCAC